MDSNFLTRNIVAKRVTPRIVRALECFIIEKCRSRNDDVLVIAEQRILIVAENESEGLFTKERILRASRGVN